MERVQVSSSSIAAIGYDESSSTLEIEFNNGSVYQYFDVPKSVYDDLWAAESRGAFLSKHIKGRFRFSRA